MAALRGTAEQKREQAFLTFPALLEHYGGGAASRAADDYEDARDAESLRSRFVAAPVESVQDRRLFNSIAWASQPMVLMDAPRSMEERLADAVEAEVQRRFQEIVSEEVPRQYRDTIRANTKRDTDATGWRRVTSGAGCKFCRMLADKGAVYRRDTARFAAHPNCSCTAWPAFVTNDDGEASVMQYMASKRRRSPQEREKLRVYLNTHFPDAPG